MAHLLVECNDEFVRYLVAAIVLRLSLRLHGAALDEIQDILDLVENPPANPDVAKRVSLG
jgi:hypothetical protein